MEETWIWMPEKKEIDMDGLEAALSEFSRSRTFTVALPGESEETISFLRDVPSVLLEVYREQAAKSACVVDEETQFMNVSELALAVVTHAFVLEFLSSLETPKTENGEDFDAGRILPIGDWLLVASPEYAALYKKVRAAGIVSCQLKIAGYNRIVDTVVGKMEVEAPTVEDLMKTPEFNAAMLHVLEGSARKDAE